MRIIYLHQYFLTPDQAGGTRSYEMARRLAANGHDVHLISSWREKDAPAVLERDGWFVRQIDGFTVHFLPVPYSNRMSYGSRIKAFFQFALKAGKRAKIVGGDVVFATSTPLTIAIPAVQAKKRLGVPMVFEVRDLWPELPIAMGALRNPLLIRAARWLERYAYRHASRVVALSPGMAEGVIRTGYDAMNISEIPNSADLSLFDPSSVTPDEFLTDHPELAGGEIVLYPGTLGKINGVGWLAELAAKVKTRLPDVRFVVIGDGMERELIEDKARELQVLGDNFFMLPSMPKRRLVSAFAAASVVTPLFIDLPEMEANSANKFFDALASGTAVAINYGGWQKQLLETSGAGISMGHDVGVAAEVLIELLSSPGRLNASGKAARHLAETRFSRDRLALQLEQTLLDAVGLKE